MLDKARVFTTLLLFFLLASCGKSEKFFLIEGELDNPKGISTVFLEELNEETLDYKVISISQVIDGKFRFQQEFVEPKLRYLRFTGKKERLAVLLEENVSLMINTESILKSKVLSGVENSFLFDYNAKSLTVREQSLQFKKKNSKLMKIAREANNKKVVDSLLKVNYEINHGYIDNMEKHLSTSPNTYVSLMLIDGLFEYPNVKKSKIEGYYKTLNDKYKEMSLGREIKNKLDRMKQD
ncbi:DUF4369 domain-containing protein [Flavobacterium sp. TBRC 19031]|uniref:DUF4369 domain-containing protein n=1 Tax=Flavobacterium mekongense TaxID=3379707 RepID=UPI00399A5DAC